MIYLDYAAATPMDKRVLKAMEPYYLQHFANPSAITYEAGRKAKAALSKARSDIAKQIGAKPTEIIFTAGGTEANNLAVQGVLKAHPNSNIIISPIEHPSIYEVAKNYNHKICQVDATGQVDLNSIKKLIDKNTVLISIILANHEIGTVQPIKEIAKLVSEIRKDRISKGQRLPLYLHTDACQATNYLDLHVSKLGVDLMTVNGSKIYGPKQSGFLWLKTGININPLIYGGGQERGLRSGTENLPAVVGLAKAMEINSSIRKEETRRVEELRDHFIFSLQSTSPRIKVNGSLSRRIANNVHITIDGIDNEWLLIKLDEKGIEAAAGSACSASSEQPSSVLKALGLSDKSARSSVRFSLGRQTTKADLNKCLQAIKSLLS